jgi:hypothetical protein|tara:strand:+ start:4010 stop:4387 length:378 start_codon:yes stop_codon:yes gene_type:complete
MMGRYYHGDIEGKFWFGVQPSDDPKFFGAVEEPGDTVDYYTEDLSLIENGIARCREEIGDYLEQMQHFYNKIVSNPKYAQTLSEWLNVPEHKADNLRGWYARLELGEKMYLQVKEHGSCFITAEL